jgi:hypothetical protein
MMGDPLKEAKLEKLRQLKKLMYELMAEEGMADEPMDMSGGISGAMEAAEIEVSGEPEEAEEDMKAVDEEAGEDEPMTELMKMKKEYFKPKTMERRPGTAMIFKSNLSPTSKMSDPEPMKFSKKAKHK